MEYAEYAEYEEIIHLLFTYSQHQWIGPRSYEVGFFVQFQFSCLWQIFTLISQTFTFEILVKSFDAPMKSIVVDIVHLSRGIVGEGMGGMFYPPICKSFTCLSWGGRARVQIIMQMCSYNSFQGHKERQRITLMLLLFSVRGLWYCFEILSSEI